MKKHLKHEENVSYPNSSDIPTISNKESHKNILPYVTQKQQSNIDLIQSESNPYSQSISEGSDSDDSTVLIINEDPTIHNDYYDLSSHSLDNLNEPKSTIPKLEDQPSTSSGSGSNFLPLFYIEREDITEESVPYQSVSKLTELEIENIIMMKKSCELTCTATRYIHSNVVEVALVKDHKTMVENKKWKELRQNLRNDIRTCDQLYHDIFFEDKQPIEVNVQLLKKCCQEARAKSLLRIFPTEDDVTINKPVFNPKNKHKATILQRKQYIIIKFINKYLVGKDRRHPFLKCIADEVFHYIRNMRQSKLKGSKCMQVTELLAVLCNQYNLLDIAQAFIYDCLYWLKMLAFPLVFSMVKIYPEVFPHSEKDSDPVSKTFVHCILTTPKTSRHTYLNYLLPLKTILWNYYKYSKDSENLLVLLKTLLTKITEPGVIEGMLLICKRQRYDWVYDNLVKVLLDFFMEKKIKNEMFAVASIRLIGMVMKAFPKFYSEYTVNTVISILEQLLLDPKGSVLVKEEIALALCRLIKFNKNKCIAILAQWIPSKNRVSENTMRIMTNIIKWECNSEYDFENIIQNSDSSRQGVSYESLSEEEDVK